MPTRFKLNSTTNWSLLSVSSISLRRLRFVSYRSPLSRLDRPKRSTYHATDSQAGFGQAPFLVLSISVRYQG